MTKWLWLTGQVFQNPALFSPAITEATDTWVTRRAGGFCKGGRRGPRTDSSRYFRRLFIARPIPRGGKQISRSVQINLPPPLLYFKRSPLFSPRSDSSTYIHTCYAGAVAPRVRFIKGAALAPYEKKERHLPPLWREEGNPFRESVKLIVLIFFLTSPVITHLILPFNRGGLMLKHRRCPFYVRHIRFCSECF